MITCQLLKNHAGVLLIGDYLSLRKLHDVIYEVNKNSPLLNDSDGWLMALAFDVRKAYEQQREIVKPDEHYPEIGPRYGVEILWPVLLAQHRILRVSLAHMDHSKYHQAMTYLLEAAIEEALVKDFGAESSIIKDLWLGMDAASTEFNGKINSRGALFSSWTKKQRRDLLANLLYSFDPMYETMYGMKANDSENNIIPPEVFAEWDVAEWPDPKW